MSQPVVTFNPLISSGLSAPVDIVSANDGTNRMFIVEQGGTVKIMSNGTVSAANFLDISSIIGSGGERGLLSMAFHPQYSTNGYFFVYYTNPSGDVTVAQYHVSAANPNQADAASGKVLIAVTHREFANHNGGKLNFGADGNLYFALGDGGSGGDPHSNAQNGTVYLGKMLRINVDNFTTPPYYTIPADNPYVTDASVADEIWALGLRNPFRWSFDRLTHDMWIGDVGQDLWEEVDFRPAGSTGGVNYGWRCREANHAYDNACAGNSGFTSPVFEYGHNAAGGISITGGMVYRGTDYPALYGWYICVDYGTGNGWLIKPDGSGGFTTTAQTGLPASVVGFGENEAGELYAVGVNGRVYRVQSQSTLPVKLQAFQVAAKNGRHQLSWTIAAGQDVAGFEIEYSSDGSSFQQLGKVTASGSANYQLSYAVPPGNQAFYRLKIVDKNGATSYSPVVKMAITDDDAVQIAPTLIRNGQLTIKLSRTFNSMQIIDANGQVVKRRAVDATTGTINTDLSGLPKGLYIVKITGSNRDVTRRIIIQ